MLNSLLTYNIWLQFYDDHIIMVCNSTPVGTDRILGRSDRITLQWQKNGIFFAIYIVYVKLLHCAVNILPIVGKISQIETIKVP